MQKTVNIDQTIQSGLKFLAGQQLKNGGFESFSSPTIKPFRSIRSWQTVFVPALMLISLSELDDRQALDIRNKLVKFLLAQQDDTGSFNYWSKEADEYEDQPYPNDLDDTFCALAGLCLHDPSLIDSGTLAKTVKLLLATEAAVGGPYRTWLVPKDSQPVWLDVDIAVNSNIAYFLSLTGNRLAQLDEIVGQAIADNSYKSPYYPSECVFLYYFARSYQGAQHDKLLHRVRRMLKVATTDLDRALGVCAQLRLGDTQGVKIAVEDLVASQRRDGSWPAATFYADPVKDGRLYYNGAPALTTACALEALQLFLKIRNSAAKAKIPKDNSKSASKKKILNLARQQCRDLHEDLRKPTVAALEQIATGSNGAEIIGLAEQFSDGLLDPIKDMPPDFIAKLSLANLYGWLAYTVYDDFLDEDGKPAMIPVANVAMRRSLDNFTQALEDDLTFAGFVRRVFDTIDSANAWELANCRFDISNNKITLAELPDYGNLSKLADRSLGHAIAPMAVLATGGKSPKTTNAQDLLQAFRHYLIARQLNDDAHDWAEDLQKGHITAVVAMILKDLKIESGTHNLAALLPRARQQFWHATLPKICRLMQQNVKLSRQALGRSRTLKSDNVLMLMLDKIETSIEDTLYQQSQAKDFLKHYKRPDKKGSKL